MLLLHIGHEKTGITSIQTSLFSNENYLESLGILVPTLFGAGDARSIPAIYSIEIDDYFERKSFNQKYLSFLQKTKKRIRNFLKKFT